MIKYLEADPRWSLERGEERITATHDSDFVVFINNEYSDEHPFLGWPWALIQILTGIACTEGRDFCEFDAALAICRLRCGEIFGTDQFSLGAHYEREFQLSIQAFARQEGLRAGKGWEVGNEHQ